MKKPITTLLCDDHALVRRTLATWLQTADDIQVVAETNSADEAVNEVGRLRPNVAVLDIDMPGRQSFEAARTMRTISPQTRILFLSGFCQDRYIEQALVVEASGYVLKGEQPEQIIAAIRTAASGAVYFSPEVQSRLVVDSKGARLAAPPRQTRVGTLTPRELEVLQYLARGMSKKVIARTMHLSLHTVNRHTTSVMNKLDIHDRVELARFAIREQLSEA